MSVVLSRVGETGARNSAPQEEVSGLLRGTPPAVCDTSCGESLESDEGAPAHCNSSALCVPLEDPGETVPMLRNSAVGCYSRWVCCSAQFRAVLRSSAQFCAVPPGGL